MTRVFRGGLGGLRHRILRRAKEIIIQLMNPFYKTFNELDKEHFALEVNLLLRFASSKSCIKSALR